MTTYTWIGQTGAWSDGQNWLIDGAFAGATPGSLDLALLVLSAAYTVSVGDATVDALAIADAAATLRIDGMFLAGQTAAGGVGNSGVIAVADGATLTVGSRSGTSVLGGFANSGIISLGAESALLVYAAASSAGLGTIENFGGTVILAGALDNSGATLDVGALGATQLAATVLGGTIAGDMSALSIAPFIVGGVTAKPILVGVTYAGLLAVDHTLEIAGGLTVLAANGSAPGRIDIRSGLFIGDDETLDNLQIELGPVGSDSTAELVSAATLTLGPHAILQVDDAPDVQHSLIADQLVLQGSIVVAGTLVVLANSVVNAGSIAVGAGAALIPVNETLFENDGVIAVSGGSVGSIATLSGSGTVSLAQGGVLNLGTVSGGQTVAFLDGTGILNVSAATGLSLATPGFTAGDIVFFANLPSPAASATYANGTLDVVGQDGSAIAHLGIPTVPGNAVFGVGNTGSTGVLFESIPCFAAGTRILTPEGEVPVERLTVGQRVVTRSGAARPIVWLGCRAVDCRRHKQVQPVRILSEAFGPGQPRRDLWLSPDHAVWFNGVLIPVHRLVNGRTICRMAVAQVVYHHVELAGHDVILAEGLPCESYLDTGNRHEFANAVAMSLRPEFAHRGVQGRGVQGRGGQGRGCAPLVQGGALLDAAQAHLRRQAVALGHRVTADADLRVLADGCELPVRIDGAVWRVRLPARARQLRIVSRAWVPVHMRAGETDPRRLGVALRDIRVDGAALRLDDPRLSSGWHGIEADGNGPFRWTDGDAGLALAGASGLAFAVVMAGRYWVRPAMAARGLAPPRVHATGG